MNQIRLMELNIIIFQKINRMHLPRLLLTF